jgi:hypothetical protein
MQFWEKYVEGVSPPPQIFDPGGWVVTPPGVWDTINGGYKNCTNYDDLTLVSTESLSDVGDIINLRFDIKVLNILNPLSAIIIYDDGGILNVTEVDISGLPIGTSTVTAQVFNYTRQWQGRIHVVFIQNNNPCDLLIQNIFYYYDKASGGTGGTITPSTEYSIQVNPTGPLDLCNSPGGETITFSSFNFLEAYAGRFKISYLSGSSYEPLYYSFINESEVTVELPLYDDKLYFASKPYPLVNKEALSISATIIGGRMLVNPYDKAEALDISGVLLSGTLRASVQTYNNNWTPEAMDTSAQLLSGTLQRVLGYVSNSFYQPEAIDASAQLLSGTLQRVVGYVSNSFYQPEAIDTSAQFLAGTIQVVLAYRSNSYYSPEAMDVSAQILGGTLA